MAVIQNQPVPLQTRTGYGYVFSSAFISEDVARDHLLSQLHGRATTDPRTIKFKTGRRQVFWAKNCVALGLASGFLEPLESTSIHLIQSGIMRLLGLFPGETLSSTEIAQFNRDSIREIEDVRDFIILHYKVGKRDDTPFWRYCRNIAIPPSLQQRIDLFKVRGRIVRRGDELFTPDSWLAVMLGKGILPEDYDPIVDTVDGGEVHRFVRHVREMVEKNASALPSHEAFLTQCCATVTPSVISPYTHAGALTARKLNCLKECKMNYRKLRTLLTSAVSLAAIAFGAAEAAPIETLDRNGAWVSVEAYGPNVVHVTIAVDKREALKGPITTTLHWNDANGTLTANGTDKGFAKSAPNLVKVVGR